MAEQLEHPRESGGRAPWRVRDIVYAMLAALVAYSVLASVAISVASIGDETGDVAYPAWTLASLYIVFVAIAWFFSVRKYRVGWHVLGLRAPSGRWPFALAALALLASLLVFTAYRLAAEQSGVGWLQPPEVPSEVFGVGLERALNVVAIVGLAPFVEEVFFRGFVLGGLAAAFGDLWAVVISSALFTLMHVSPATFIPLFVTAMLLGWLYLRTRSIWPPIAAHSTQNALAMLGSAY